MNYVTSLLYQHQIQILTINETWLTSEIADSTVNIPGYQIIRSDNPGLVKKHGVAIYISNSIKFVVVNCLLNLLVVYFSLYDIYLISVYRPPSYSFDENESIINFLLDFCCDKEIVLLGDFNLPSLNWSLDNVFDEYISPLDSWYFSTFTQIGLDQIVKNGTHFPSGHILDLVLTTNSERVGSCDILPPLPRCCHAPVIFSYVFQCLSDHNMYNNELPTYLWTKGNYSHMARILSGVDWDIEFLGLSADLQYAKLLNILYPLIRRYVPTRNINRGGKLPWNVNPPRSQKQECSYIWDNFKSKRSLLGRNHSETLIAWNEFRGVIERLINFFH